MRILVTGGTGKVGSEVIKELVKRNVSVRALVRKQEASTTMRYRRALAFPEPSDGSTVSCRLDSQRLPGSYRSEIGTWQDRVSHVPSHISCVAGRDRSTRGRATETHATRARLNHNGPVRQRLGLGQAQSQSPDRATPLAKACQSRSLHSINKGNCVSVPPYWTVLDSRCECPIARNLMIALVAGGGFEPPTFGL
jgi:hypothetical protein